VPTYYHSLSPFRDIFRTGTPALTYHKLGPRPPGARLKGLYVGEQLFRQQLEELREAGFTTPPLSEMFPVRPQPRKTIALTFDDGFSNVLRYGLQPLAENNFHAIQFVVADRIGKTNEWDRAAGEAQEPLMDLSQVREWLAAGHEIGSHTCTHPSLTRISPSQAREEIFSSKRKLEDLFGRAVEHFCYPYGDWNENIRDLVAEAGYKTAFTTVSGINTPTDPAFALKRFTARYPSRNLKAIWARLFSR
jgi:peptidoglycan/xylan/chitin deacetylase (PgdA/CDA1 family)